MHKAVKVTAVVLACLLLVYLAGGMVAANYLYTLALSPTADRSSMIAIAHEREKPASNAAGQSTRDWYAAQGPEDVYLTSFDGLALYASCLPNDTPSHRWIIACHGYMGNYELMLAAAVRGRGWGYNVLLPDARACGNSEGEAYGMGWLDRFDLLGWVDWVLARDSAAEIVLYGMSMGGATVLMASGEPLPAQVKAVVSDCAYASVSDELVYVLDSLVGISAAPLLPFCNLVCRLRAGYSLYECDTIAQVSRSTVPILLIHGESDTFVPYTMMDQLYDAIPGEKARLSIPGARHGQASYVDGKAYWGAIHEFLQRHVG